MRKISCIHLQKEKEEDSMVKNSVVRYWMPYLLSLAWLLTAAVVAIQWADRLYQQTGEYPGEWATWGIIIGSAVITFMIGGAAIVLGIYAVLALIYGPPAARQKMKQGAAR